MALPGDARAFPVAYAAADMIVLGDTMSKFVMALVALLALPSANLAVAEPPAPSMSDAEQNVLFAVTQLCAPFVLDRIDTAALPLKERLVVTEATHDAGSEPTLRVGAAGFVRVRLKHTGEERSCDVTASRAPPAKLRNAFLAAVAQRPERFAPTAPARGRTQSSFCPRLPASILTVSPRSLRSRMAPRGDVNAMRTG